MTNQVIYAIFLLFCSGIFITIASRNILKIFIGLLISYSCAIALLFVSKNPFCIEICTILSAIAPVISFASVFTITKIYKKFNTLDIDKIEKTVREEKW